MSKENVFICFEETNITTIKFFLNQDFRDLKVISNFLNVITYFYYHSIVANKKINSITYNTFR